MSGLYNRRNLPPVIRAKMFYIAERHQVTVSMKRERQPQEPLRFHNLHKNDITGIAIRWRRKSEVPFSRDEVLVLSLIEKLTQISRAECFHFLFLCPIIVFLLFHLFLPFYPISHAFSLLYLLNYKSLLKTFSLNRAWLVLVFMV